MTKTQKGQRLNQIPRPVLGHRGSSEQSRPLYQARTEVVETLSPFVSAFARFSCVHLRDGGRSKQAVAPLGRDAAGVLKTQIGCTQCGRLPQA